MNRVRRVVRDERGIAVVAALVALMALSALVLAFLAMSIWEPQISRNLADGTRARYVAEAGLEWAYDQLITNPNWNGFLGGATCATGAPIGAVNQTLPGLTVASGTFTVRVRNDCGANDALMTGWTAEPAANATNDTNNHVILTSTGTFGTATKTLVTVVSRVANPLNPDAPPSGELNSALAFPGYESDTSFTGNSFEVDGRNHDLNGDLVTSPPSSLLGISVGPEDQFVAQGGPVMHHEASVQNSLSSQQKDNVTGHDQSTGQLNSIGDNTIAPGSMTSQAITDFANAIASYADITITSTNASTTVKVNATGATTSSSGAAVFNNVGASCGGNYNAGDCWGTRANPKIVVVNGAMDTTSLFTALDVRGNSEGYGILIVRDGDLALRGNFHWEGPIIVTGGYVGVGFMGGGWQDVLGALVSNETATNEAQGFYEGVLQGNAKVRYSREALDNALAMLGRKIPGTGSSPYVTVRMYNLKEQ